MDNCAPPDRLAPNDPADNTAAARRPAIPSIACLVVGVGNMHRSDDQAGLATARLVQQHLDQQRMEQPSEILEQHPQTAAGQQVEILESTGDGAELIEHFSRARAVIVIDAAHHAASGGVAPDPRSGSGAKEASSGAGISPVIAGTIHRIDAVADPVPVSLLSGTSHAFGVAEAVEFARALGKLPERLIIYGIEAKSFDIGGQMSEEVIAAAEEVAALIANDEIHAFPWPSRHG